MSEYANYDDYNDPDEENEYDAARGNKLTVGKIIKKTFIYCLRLLAVFVFAILIWRIMSSGDPKTVKTFLWNESAISAYNENPSKFLAYYYKHPDNLTSDGKFAASNVFFVPSTGQFQITVRYNDSTVKYLTEEYELKEEPTGEIFVYTLTDNLGNTYTEYEYISDTKNIYNYRRVVFDGIDMNATKVVEEDGREVTKKFEYLTLNVYYAEDVVLSQPYGVLPVYDSEYYHEPIDLDEYMFKNNTPDALTAGIEYTVKEEPEETAQE